MPTLLRILPSEGALDLTLPPLSLASRYNSTLEDQVTRLS